FAGLDINPQGENGWIHGAPIQMARQLLGIGIAIVWSGFWTFVLVLFLKQIHRITGYCIVRANEQDEIYGLDRKEHGHVAYHDLMLESDEEEEEEGRDIEVGHAAAHTYGSMQKRHHGDGVRWNPKAYLAINNTN